MFMHPSYHMKQMFYLLKYVICDRYSALIHKSSFGILKPDPQSGNKQILSAEEYIFQFVLLLLEILAVKSGDF